MEIIIFMAGLISNSGALVFTGQSQMSHEEGPECSMAVARLGQTVRYPQRKLQLFHEVTCWQSVDEKLWSIGAFFVTQDAY